MPVLAFWNVNANVSPKMIAALAREWDVDVLVIAECGVEAETLRKALDEHTARLYFSDHGVPNRLTILTRFRTGPAALVRDAPRIAIRHYQMPVGESFLLVAVHLPSKLWANSEDQIFIASELSREIDKAEAWVGHTRTIVIGDLNMNPFEAGIVGAGGLHGVMDRRVAASGYRVVRQFRRPFFYNPMWSKFGDAGGSPPGTYFRNDGLHVSYFWHMFDQVLLRPTLLGSLDHDGVDIVTEVGGQSLLTDRGRPDDKVASDHLPVICRLNVIQEGENVIAKSLG